MQIQVNTDNVIHGDERVIEVAEAAVTSKPPLSSAPSTRTRRSPAAVTLAAGLFLLYASTNGSTTALTKGFASHFSFSVILRLTSPQRT